MLKWIEESVVVYLVWISFYANLTRSGVKQDGTISF